MLLSREPPRVSAPATLPLGFSNGQVEALKWLGMAAMVLDHVGRLLLGHGEQSWVFAVSRIAFPLFALSMALNLSRDGDRPRRALRTARRLALWCAVSVLPAVWARGDPALVNVLGTLALGALLCWAFEADSGLGRRLAVTLAACLAAAVVEFDLPGVVLILGFYLWLRHRRLDLAVFAAILLALTGWLNAVFGGQAAFLGTLALVPLAALVRFLPLPVPRVQWVFYVFYPAHLAVIGVLRQSWIG
jgi:hypothetical protein